MLPGLGGVTCGKVVSCEETTDTAQAKSISFACCFLSQGFKHFLRSEYIVHQPSITRRAFFMEIVFWWEIESGFCRRPSPANVVFCFTEKQDLFLCWHLIFSKGKPSH